MNETRFDGPERYTEGTPYHVVLNVPGGNFWITFPDLQEAQRYCAKAILAQWAERWVERYAWDVDDSSREIYVNCLDAYRGGRYDEVVQRFTMWFGLYGEPEVDPDFYVTPSLVLDRPQELLDLDALTAAHPIPELDEEEDA